MIFLDFVLCQGVKYLHPHTLREQQPFEDVSPIRNGDVPAGHSLVFRGV